LTSAEEALRDSVARRWPTRLFKPASVVRHNPARTPLPLSAAARTGHLTVRAGAVVKRIRVNAPGTAAGGVEFVDRASGASAEVHGRVVVLCASAVESVRILLNSATTQHPDGLGNSSGMLGRFLMDHTMVTISGELPDRLASPGPRHAAPDDPYDLASNHVYMPGFRNISEPGATTPGSFCIVGSAGRSPGRFGFVGFGDMEASADNRITVDATARDAWGIPVAVVDCTHTANDRMLIKDMMSTMRDVVGAAGFRVRPGFGESGGGIRNAVSRRRWRHVLTPDGAYHPGAAIHEMGGARMGTEPRSSVLNPFNQCWDVPNVFVTDAACFVSSGHQPHTLTMMALTVRACDFIVAQCRAGAL
jgi:choline dehydrogenase-like flavoprotein